MNFNWKEKQLGLFDEQRHHETQNKVSFIWVFAWQIGDFVFFSNRIEEELIFFVLLVVID